MDMPKAKGAFCDYVKAPKENVGILVWQMNADTYAVS
jgi:hypothetical protein